MHNSRGAESFMNQKIYKIKVQFRCWWLMDWINKDVSTKSSLKCFCTAIEGAALYYWHLASDWLLNDKKKKKFPSYPYREPKVQLWVRRFKWKDGKSTRCFLSCPLCAVDRDSLPHLFPTHPAVRALLQHKIGLLWNTYVNCDCKRKSWADFPENIWWEGWKRLELEVHHCSAT